MHGLTAFQRDTLVVLAGLQPAPGVEVIDELDSYYETEVFAGRFYPSVEELVEAGFVAKDSADGRTNLYSLTDDGDRRLRRYRGWVDQQLGQGE